MVWGTYPSLAEPGRERGCEQKLRSIETAPWAGSPVPCCAVSLDSDSVGPGGGAGTKEETRGR